MAKLEHKSLPVLAFVDQAAFDVWLSKHHQSTAGIWLRYYKKHSGLATIAHSDAIDSALCWGWIDGLINKYDADSYLVRFTPRRPKSVWSKINVAKAEHLIEHGRMQPSGLLQVQAAQADGRWQAAYAGQATISVPPEFLRLLDTDDSARAFYHALNKANRYAIAFRIATAVGDDARNRMMDRLLAMLKDRKSFHA